MHIRNLPLLGSIFLSSLVALGACSSSSSSGTGGTTGSLAGTTGSTGGTTGAVGGTTGAAGGHIGSAGGSTGTGAGGATVSCGNIPTCVATLLSGCNQTGTCTSSRTTTATGITSTSCYSNGVKSNQVTTIDLTTETYSSMTVVSKNGATCYSYTGVANPGAGGASGALSFTLTFKNAQGTTVGTLTETDDGAGNSLDTVTCDGQTTTVTDLGDCDMPSSTGNGGSSGSSDCTMSAACTP